MRTWAPLLATSLLLGGALARAQPADGPEGIPAELLTVAERSAFRATASHAEVEALVARLARRSPHVHRVVMGTSGEGRAISVLIVADPPVRSPAELASAKERPLVLLLGNIHGGEVCGKEALLMLARELATTADHPLKQRLVIAIAPLYNPDGNEPLGEGRRESQNGPEAVGHRTNAAGLDLNRDYVKLEAPETRALARFVRRWDPAIVVDTHTTNGTRHRHLITHATPKHPAGDPLLASYARDTFLAAVARHVTRATGMTLAPYGNLSADRTTWTTYPAFPRYGTPYRGLRNRIGILSEAYSHATFEERVRGTEAFVRAILEEAAQRRDEIRAAIAEADGATTQAGAAPSPEDRVAIATRAEPTGRRIAILGYEDEAAEDGTRRWTDRPRTWTVDLENRFVAAKSVVRPWAYAIDARCAAAIENLQRHGLRIDVLREDVVVDAEIATIREVERTERKVEGHRLVSLVTATTALPVRLAAGTFVVRTAQPLGSLAVVLLEAEAEDGLATWGFFGEGDGVGLEPGGRYPVTRLPAPTALLLAPATPLAEDRPARHALGFSDLGRRGGPDLAGRPVSIRWDDDGEHYLVPKGGALVRVETATGRGEPAPRDGGPDRFAASLATIPGLSGEAVRALGRRVEASAPDGTARVHRHDGDLWLARRDGTPARRLTSTPKHEESVVTFSPDGATVAFVIGGDLHVVGAASGEPRGLTVTRPDLVQCGRAAWVYFEEVFGRSWRTYWWSPDSKRIAFLRTDSSGVPRFTLVDDAASEQRLEAIDFPKPGDPNPSVKLGVVEVATGEIMWPDVLGEKDAALITGVGFWPDSTRLWVYVQDRAQTWLDLMIVAADGTSVARGHRETTEAWVSKLPDPRFLDDGSFLWLRDTTGWRHVYRHDENGAAVGAVTSGEWAVGSIVAVDEANGLVYVTGAKDGATAANLYRVPLAGGDATRLTEGNGEHRVSIDPTHRWFADTRSGFNTSPRVTLHRIDGAPVRTLDLNPVRALDRYDLGEIEPVRITTRDGATIDATILRPPGFDPAKRWPVWFLTYGGPHAPTVRDAWQGGRAFDRALASLGIVVFRADPRSASGRSARSAWHAYRRLGVTELQDIEDAIGWLAAHDWIDAKRIGMSGHSYGGYLTAYAMTHSKLFAAGIAGAPVTDWRDYDSIYTERYMGSPAENAKGYDASSVVKAAADLHGRLLLVHGTMDDNVHLQHTLRLVRELQRVNRPFELMLYPQARHGIGGKHYRELQLDFIRRTLLEGAVK